MLNPNKEKAIGDISGKSIDCTEISVINYLWVNTLLRGKVTKRNKILKDLSHAASSTISNITHMTADASRAMKEYIKSTIKSMDFVTKAEFTALKKSVETLMKKNGTDGLSVKKTLATSAKKSKAKANKAVADAKAIVKPKLKKAAKKVKAIKSTKA